MGMESFSQTQLEKPLRNRRCSACITDKFELIDPSVPLSGADASMARGQQTTTALRPEHLGLGPQDAHLCVAAGDGERLCHRRVAIGPDGGWPDAQPGQQPVTSSTRKFADHPHQVPRDV